MARATLCQVKRALKPPGMRARFLCQSQVPFSCHIGVVSGVAHDFRQRSHAIIEVAFISGMTNLVCSQFFIHMTQAGQVIVCAGEQHGTRGRTGGRGIKLREQDTVVSEGVQVRCVYFTPEYPEIGISQVVRND